jgi:hypothetical protein
MNLSGTRIQIIFFSKQIKNRILDDILQLKSQNIEIILDENFFIYNQLKYNGAYPALLILNETGQCIYAYLSFLDEDWNNLNHQIVKNYISK